MTLVPKPYLAQDELEAISFEEVMKRLIEAKPKQRAKKKDPKSTNVDTKLNSSCVHAEANDR
jgi:hypothetical protein